MGSTRGEESGRVMGPVVEVQLQTSKGRLGSQKGLGEEGSLKVTREVGSSSGWRGAMIHTLCWGEI